MDNTGHFTSLIEAGVACLFVWLLYGDTIQFNRQYGAE